MSRENENAEYQKHMQEFERHSQLLMEKLSPDERRKVLMARDAYIKSTIIDPVPATMGMVMAVAYLMRVVKELDQHRE